MGVLMKNGIQYTGGAGGNVEFYPLDDLITSWGAGFQKPNIHGMYQRTTLEPGFAIIDGKILIYDFAYHCTSNTHDYHSANPNSPVVFIYNDLWIDKIYNFFSVPESTSDTGRLNSTIWHSQIYKLASSADPWASASIGNMTDSIHHFMGYGLPPANVKDFMLSSNVENLVNCIVRFQGTAIIEG